MKIEKTLVDAILDKEFTLRNIGILKEHGHKIQYDKYTEDPTGWFFEYGIDSNIEISPLLSIYYYRKLQKNGSWIDYLRALTDLKQPLSPLLSVNQAYEFTQASSLAGVVSCLRMSSKFNSLSPSKLVHTSTLSHFDTTDKQESRFYQYLSYGHSKGVDPHPLVSLKYLRDMLVRYGVPMCDIEQVGPYVCWLANGAFKIPLSNRIENLFYCSTYLAKQYTQADYVHSLFDREYTTRRSAIATIDVESISNLYGIKTDGLILSTKLRETAANEGILTAAHLKSRIPLVGHIEVYTSQLSALWPVDISHLILMPFCQKGGMEKCVEFYVKRLVELGARPLVVITDSFLETNTGISKVCTVINLPMLGIPNDVSLKSKIVFNLLCKSKTNLLVANSEVGLRLIADFGQLLGDRIVAVTFFAMQYDDQGNPQGYIHSWLPLVIKYVDEIFSDNKTVFIEIEKYYDTHADLTKRRRFSPLEMPVELIDHTSRNSVKDEKRVLWMGRIAREKLAHLVPQIAKGLGGIASIDMWGYFDDKSLDSREFLNAEALTWKGPYKDFREVVAQNNYDVCLFTSKGEGMPNAALESLSAGIPVICSNVGGLNELIVDDVNGCLIDNVLSPEAYIVKLIELLSSDVTITRLAIGASQSVSNRNYANFSRQFDRTLFAGGI